MNSEDIERAVRRRVRRFDGVFAADRLPNDPCLLVCNTYSSHNPGEHWVAIYVDEEGRYGEYFDSFGRPPPVTFRRYLDRHCMYWSYNDVQLQSVASRFCGHYCVLYSSLFLEVVVSTCVVLSVVLLVTLVLTMCSCMDLYVCNKCNDIRFCQQKRLRQTTSPRGQIA